MKNERAAVMALTFCIGFTSALIAYGIPVTDAPVDIVVVAPRESNTASVIDSQVVTATEVQATELEMISTGGMLELREQGLFLLSDDVDKLISVSAAVAPEVESAHTDIHTPLVSHDGSFVFYCAETLESEGACFARVYDVEEESVHAVSAAGEVLSMQPASVVASWNNDGLLVLGGATSAAADIPWVLE